MANKPFKKRPVLGPPPTRAADGGIVLSEVLGAVGPSVRFFEASGPHLATRVTGNGRSRVVLPSNETAAETSIRRPRLAALRWLPCRCIASGNLPAELSNAETTAHRNEDES
jgi:hypothetical protein